jgi:hypothetical protein
MRDRTIFAIIVIIFIAYFFYSNQSKTAGTSAPSTPSVPSEYQGTKGLDYIRQNYASDLAQARNLCTSQFNGNWVDNSNTIGCYDMQGFSTAYCNTDVIQNLVSTCRSIGGSSTCSSTQASCTV